MVSFGVLLFMISQALCARPDQLALFASWWDGCRIIQDYVALCVLDEGVVLPRLIGWPLFFLLMLIPRGWLNGTVIFALLARRAMYTIDGAK